MVDETDMNGNCKRCSKDLSKEKHAAKQMCIRCYYATKHGRETNEEKLARRNYIENGIGVVTDESGNRWEFDADDFDKVGKTFWVDNGSGYARNPNVGYLHRIISPQEWTTVDHIDRNTFNCRKSNLRDGSNGVNARNKRKHGKVSRYRGIERNHDNWMARIVVDGKRRYIGTYTTEEQALQALQTFAASVGLSEFYKPQQAA